MNRKCSKCRAWKNRNDYGSNQWSKGEGISRCRDCISGCPFFVCQECDRNFNNDNELQHHKQVHLPRNIQCDECGEQRFKSHANVQQHIESGCCQGCHYDSRDDDFHSCTICERGFKRKSQLLQHQESKHNRILTPSKRNR